MMAHTPKHPLVFQCPLCKSLTTMESFSTSEQGLELTCNVCKKDIFLPTSSNPDSVDLEFSGKKKAKMKEPKSSSRSSSKEIEKKEPDKFIPAIQETDQRSCPKCFSRVSKKTDDCPKCGLSFGNVGRTFDPNRMMEAQTPLEERALELWSELESDWENEAKHERFLQFCHLQGLLELAAFHYQKEKGSGGANVLIASKKLSRIVELVQQQFLLQQEERDSISNVIQKGKWFLVIGILVFGSVAFYVIWKAMSGSSMQIQIP